MNIPLSELSVSQGAHCLVRGGLVLYPTETFYALGCAVCNADAVARVYQVKRRAVYKPLPVIAADVTQIAGIALLTPEAQALTDAFWPAPLTVLLPALSCVPEAVTGGTGKVAVRVSPHSTVVELARRAGTPLVASSANISGNAPVTRAELLDAHLLQQADGLVTQGPQPAGGLPSTLVEVLEDKSIRLLREGAVPKATLQAQGYSVYDA